MNRTLDFSLLVSTQSRSAGLQRLLTSITASDVDMGRGEIVVVQNSIDTATAVVLNDFSSLLPLRVISEHRGGQSCALNTGIEACRGNLIILTDDDAAVSHHCIQSYLDGFAHSPNGGYFIGPIEPVFPKNPSALWLRHAPPSHRGRDLGPCRLSWRQAGKSHDLIGVNAAVPRALLQQLRFCERLGPGSPYAPLGADVQLGRRILGSGHAADYVPHAMVRHHILAERLTLRYLLGRRRNVGMSCVLYDRAMVPATLPATMARLASSSVRMFGELGQKRSVDEIFELFRLLGVAEAHIRVLLHGAHDDCSGSCR